MYKVDDMTNEFPKVLNRFFAPRLQTNNHSCCGIKEQIFAPLAPLKNRKTPFSACGATAILHPGSLNCSRIQFGIGHSQYLNTGKAFLRVAAVFGGV
jgi:hypothetical protein